MTQTARQSKDSRNVNSGFSLLEVMIALAIVSIALMSLLSLGNRSIGVNDRLQRVTQATLLAQHKMAETETAGTGQGQATAGVFDEPFEMYRWRLEYTGTPLPSVSQVTVTVAWGDEEKN
ncbi:MAG: type II secretion system protein GspI, partial [Desulfuromonas sp.]